jgi:hypothetical protein
MVLDEHRALAILDGVFGLRELGDGGQGQRDTGRGKGQRGKAIHRGSFLLGQRRATGSASQFRGVCRRAVHSDNP